jgi:hypothetical protein
VGRDELGQDVAQLLVLGHHAVHQVERVGHQRTSLPRVCALAGAWALSS